MTTPSRARRLPRARLLAAAALLLAPLATAPTALAEDPPPEPISTGTLDWGVKESFRSYITGPIARGAVALDGVSANGDGTYRFTIDGGAWDPLTGSTTVATAGAVRFSGHAGELDLRLSDVRVELLPDTALLRADVVSAQLGGAAPYVREDVALATLDLDGIAPASAGGETTWSDVPTTLTADGVTAFGSFYTVGTPLDPISFTYTGNGGAPIAESFTAPGTRFYDRLEVSTPGETNLFLDSERGLLHKVGGSVNAVSSTTLETVGTPLAAAGTVWASAFDAAAGRVFVAFSDRTVAAFTWTGSGYTRDDLPGTPGGRRMAFAGGKLYLAADTANVNPVVTVVSGGPGAWSVRADHPAIDTGGAALGTLVGLPDGSVLATTRAPVAFVGGVPTVAPAREAFLLRDDGGALTTAPIAGTTPPPVTEAGRMTFGYVLARAQADGSVLLLEATAGATVARLQWLRPSPSGLVLDGEPITIRTPTQFATDPAGKIYATYAAGTPAASSVDVLTRGGQPFASFLGLLPGALQGAAGDTLYAIVNVSGRPTAKYSLAGASPVLDAGPQDAAVVLETADSSAPMSFSAGASATPAPTVRWQQRAVGQTRWSDVPGASATTLTVNATVATDGTRYRAVFENVGGRIATAAATATVTVAPVAPPQERPPVIDPPVVVPPVVAPPVVVPPVVQPPTGQPPATSRATAFPRGALRAPGAAQRPTAAGRVTVATVRCPAGAACRVRAPKTVRVKIGAKRYAVRVVAPKQVRAGRSAAVRVVLPRAARAALAGRRATVAVRLTVRADGKRALSRTVSVTVRGAAAATRG